MAIRVDWPTIRDGIINNQGAIDAPFLFILPHAGRHLLMAIIDQLRWQATYRYKGHGYDFSDWDELQSIVEATHYGLMDGEEVNQIAESITYLADTLAANMPNLNLEGVDMGNVQQVVNMGCCGGGAITNSGSCGAGIDEMPPNDAPTNPPREFPPVTTPPITPTWTEFKCNMAHYLYYVFRNSLIEISDLVSVGEANYEPIKAIIDEIIGLVTGNPGSELLWEAYYSLVTWFINRVTGTSGSDMIQEMDRHYDEFICAMYSGDGPNAQSQAVRAVIDDLALPWPARYWIKLIEEQIPYDQIFYADGWETYEFPPSFQNRVCACSGSPQQSPDVPEITGYRFIEARYGDMKHVGGNWQNLTVTNNGNETTVVYNNVSGGGADDGLEYDVNKALLDAGMNLDQLPVGVLYETISSSPTSHDSWRIRFAMGSGEQIEYSAADTPYLFGVNNSIASEQAIIDFSQWITANGGKYQSRPVDGPFDAVVLNANFDQNGATLIVKSWFLFPE